MDKPTERLRSGWLVKSPPEKQMNRKFMPANWKRRYFVLQETVPSLPGHSASLVYFKDEKCRQQKGCIDLEHCEEVLSSLDSPNYKYLFALRTVHKKKNEARTYYLAADNQSEMNKWVDGLCVVLGLKETQDEEAVAPEPAPRPPPQPVQIPPPIQPISTIRPTVGRKQGDDYIPLETCNSGPGDNGDALSSLPEGFAPRPQSTEQVEYDTPQSRLHHVDGNDNVYKQPQPRPIYDIASIPEYWAYNLDNLPPPRLLTNTATSPKQSHANSLAHESVYKYPPPRRDGPEYINQDEPTSDDIYDMPQTHPHSVVYDSPPSHASHRLKREPSERDSNSSNGSKHSVLCTDDSGLGSSTDNLAKGKRESRITSRQDVYDYPPCKQAPTVVRDGNKLLESVPPPARIDTKPKEINRAEYVNLNEPKLPQVPYDVLPSCAARKRSDVEMLQLHPPTPGLCSPVVSTHKYVNASTGVVQVTSQMRTPLSPIPGTQSLSSARSYIPMNKAAEQDSYSSKASTSPDSYLPMSDSGSDSYLPMNRTDSSYLPMAQPRLQRGSRGSDSQIGGDYLPMDNNKDRASTDSTYQIVPSGIHPINDDYDNRGLSDMYSGPPSNKLVPVERDSIYSIQPSNRPVEPRRGLDAYVPTSGGHRSPATLRSRPPLVPSRPEQDIYDTAPSNRPVPPIGKLMSQSPILNRPSFNKDRSRSFKRDLDMPVLPVSRNPEAESDSSSDDSDNDDPSSSSSHDRSQDSISKPQQPPAHPQAEYLKRNLSSTPPPPKKPGEIEYLDLGLDNPPDKERSPVFPRSPAAAGNVTPTEYHDIDFVKTQALIETRKDLESKRKSSSSKSVDD